MKTSENAISAIKTFESLHDGDLHQIGLQPKMCPAGYWTEGYGSLILNEQGRTIRGIENKLLAYKYAKIHTQQEADKALRKDIAQREEMINSLNLTQLTQGQFDALVDFCYNVGFANLKSSTLLKRIKYNREDTKAIRNAFMMWVKSGKRTLPGLVNRRTQEANWFEEK